MLQNLLTLQSRIKRISTAFRQGLITILPCSCVLCGMESRHPVCTACNRQFFTVPTTRCICCALPVNQCDQRCGQCLAEPPPFLRTIVACHYAAPLDQLILALKFGHQLNIAPALGAILARAVLQAPDQILPDLLIPVPLARARLAQRGFNQALEIARPLARVLNIPIYPQLLLRMRDTAAQTLLPPGERRDNIRHAFSPAPDYQDKIPGRHIGVVDDVMTTGATLHEIAACLKRHGAQQVTNLVFARTPPH